MISDKILADLVEQYKGEHRRRLRREVAYFADCKSLDEALSRAALAKCRCGRVLSHQRRNGKRVLRNAERRILGVSASIRRTTDFRSLYSVIKSEASGLDGFGALATYDTALRIGAYRGVYPENVYLQAGAFKVENFLCIFASRLERGRAKKPRGRNNDCDLCGSP